MRVGWVKGLNRLYFLYEAYDDYWDFSRPGLHNDTFEIVVDGDASGGPLIDKGHREFWTPEEVGEAAPRPTTAISVDEAHWAIHGVHAQNYHIFTPAEGKDWCMAWSAATWIKELPWANAAYSYNFKPGESGRLVLEFWITPFDYAGPEGPQRAVESVLTENKIIGLSFAVIDYDDVNSGATTTGSGISRATTRCMATPRSCARSSSCRSNRSSANRSRRSGPGRSSTWTAGSWPSRICRSARSPRGNGTLATARPRPSRTRSINTRRPGNYVVILDVEGPDGKSRRSKVWDVQLK